MGKKLKKLKKRGKKTIKKSNKSVSKAASKSSKNVAKAASKSSKSVAKAASDTSKSLSKSSLKMNQGLEQMFDKIGGNIKNLFNNSESINSLIKQRTKNVQEDRININTRGTLCSYLDSIELGNTDFITYYIKNKDKNNKKCIKKIGCNPEDIYVQAPKKKIKIIVQL